MFKPSERRFRPRITTNFGGINLPLAWFSFDKSAWFDRGRPYFVVICRNYENLCLITSPIRSKWMMAVDSKKTEGIVEDASPNNGEFFKCIQATLSTETQWFWCLPWLSHFASVEPINRPSNLAPKYISIIQFVCLCIGKSIYSLIRTRNSILFSSISTI